jgi:hypothetical protein
MSSHKDTWLALASPRLSRFSSAMRPMFGFALGSSVRHASCVRLMALQAGIVRDQNGKLDHAVEGFVLVSGTYALRGDGLKRHCLLVSLASVP